MYQTNGNISSSILRKDDITWTYCSKHMGRTEHLWTGHKLVCLACHPDQKPKEANPEQAQGYAQAGD